MKAEKILLAHEIALRLIPTPRHISSDCGMAIQLHECDVERARELLGKGGVRIEGVYGLEESKGEPNA